MILVEAENMLFNFSNANVIEYKDGEITIHYNNETILQIPGYESIDTSEFNEYFFICEADDRKVFLNKFQLLYLERLEDSQIKFHFYENFSYQIQADYDKMVSQT